MRANWAYVAAFLGSDDQDSLVCVNRAATESVGNRRAYFLEFDSADFVRNQAQLCCRFSAGTIRDRNLVLTIRAPTKRNSNQLSYFSPNFMRLVAPSIIALDAPEYPLQFTPGAQCAWTTLEFARVRSVDQLAIVPRLSALATEVLVVPPTMSLPQWLREFPNLKSLRFDSVDDAGRDDTFELLTAADADAPTTTLQSLTFNYVRNFKAIMQLPQWAGLRAIRVLQMSSDDVIGEDVTHAELALDGEATRINFPPNLTTLSIGPATEYGWMRDAYVDSPFRILAPSLPPKLEELRLTNYEQPLPTRLLAARCPGLTRLHIAVRGSQLVWSGDYSPAQLDGRNPEWGFCIRDIVSSIPDSIQKFQLTMIGYVRPTDVMRHLENVRRLRQTRGVPDFEWTCIARIGTRSSRAWRSAGKPGAASAWQKLDARPTQPWYEQAMRGMLL